MSFEGSDLDMPQPIHYSTGIPVDFRPEVLFRRPQLALHIALISYLWNEIEAKIGVFLATLSGNEGKTVISIFTAIQSDVAKRRIIDTIAELNLNEAEQTKFQAILKKISERYVERNRIVHGSWELAHDIQISFYGVTLAIQTYWPSIWCLLPAKRTPPREVPSY